jgi:hypothetical protein
VAGARAAIRDAGLELWQSPSATDLLASIGASPAEKRVRISPFLDFLGRGEPKNSLSEQDSAALQNWVIQRLAKQMRSGKNPSTATRRDTTLIAALCVAPAKGTPRKWPENCLKVEGREVLLWDTTIEEPMLHSLLALLARLESAPGDARCSTAMDLPRPTRTTKDLRKGTRGCEGASLYGACRSAAAPFGTDESELVASLSISNNQLSKSRIKCLDLRLALAERANRSLVVLVYRSHREGALEGSFEIRG